MQQAAESFNEDSEHTVEGIEKSGLDELWTTGLQSQSNLPPLALIRQTVLSGAARNGGIIETADLIGDYQDGLFTVAKSLNLVDGEYYTIPNDIGPFVMMYNTELFSQAGLPTEPEEVEAEMPTWKEFMQAGETVEKETGAKMLSFSPTNTNGMPGLRVQAGGGWYDDEGKFAFNQPANVEAYELLVELLDYAAPFAYFTNKYWSAYTNGEVATSVAPGWLIAFFKSNVDAAGKFRVATPPRFKEGRAFGANWGGVGAAIPFFKDDVDKQIGRDFGEHWHLSEAGVRAKLEVGIPPSYDPGGDAFDLTDDYFGGQAIWDPVRRSAENCPPAYRQPNADVASTAEGIMKDVVDEGTSVEDAVNSRHEQMLTQIDEEDMTIETL